jgi:hypothetical protein
MHNLPACDGLNRQAQLETPHNLANFTLLVADEEVTSVNCRGADKGSVRNVSICRNDIASVKL